jgi:hypothetical protein
VLAVAPIGGQPALISRRDAQVLQVLQGRVSQGTHSLITTRKLNHTLRGTNRSVNNENADDRLFDIGRAEDPRDPKSR